MRRIYLDNSATTRICDEALEKYIEVSRECYGNPSSLHALGFESEKILNTARAEICASLSAKGASVIFTASGTEANNLAIIGRAFAKERYKKGGKIITTMGEHASVDAPLEMLTNLGFTVARIPTVGGEIDMAALEKELVKLQNVGFVKGYYDGKIYYGNFNEPGYKIYSQKAEEYVATPKPVPEPKKPSKSVEEIEALVVDYFNSNYSEGYDGNFAVFSHETRESDNGYYMTVRFQANYQTMDANRWFADVEVNDETGEMFWADEYECTLW